MKSSALARRYARAALNAAGKDAAALYTSAAALAEAIEGSLAQQLANPRMGPASRMKLVDALAKTGISDILVDALRLLARNNRLAMLPEVLSAIAELQDEAAGRARVHVETATPLTAGQQEQLAKIVKQKLKAREVVVEETVSPQLIGGFRAFFGGMVWDTSLAGAMRRLRDHLTSSNV